MSAEGVRAVVREYLTSVSRYISAVQAQSPGLTPAQVLERPDVKAAIDEAVAEARDYAHRDLLEAWDAAGSQNQVTLNHLKADIDKAYGTEYGLRHVLAGPADIADAYARRVALRNSLTVQFGGRYSAESVVLELAEEDDPGLMKKWVAHPENPACCFWCRRLHGVTIPLKADFGPYLGGPAVLSTSGRHTKPPKTYHGRLLHPPLHPNCECHLATVRNGVVHAGQNVADNPAPPPFLSSSDIRAMPAAKYRVLIEFIKAAAHELGQVLRRLQRS